MNNSNSNTSSISSKSPISDIKILFSPGTIKYSNPILYPNESPMCVNATLLAKEFLERKETLDKICKDFGDMENPNITVTTIKNKDHIIKPYDKNSDDKTSEYKDGILEVSEQFCNEDLENPQMSINFAFPKDPGYVTVVCLSGNGIVSITTVCVKFGQLTPKLDEGTISTIRAFCTNKLNKQKGYGWTINITMLMAIHVQFVGNNFRGFQADGLKKALGFWTGIIGFKVIGRSTKNVSRGIIKEADSSESVGLSIASSQRSNDLFNKFTEGYSSFKDSASSQSDLSDISSSGHTSRDSSQTSISSSSSELSLEGLPVIFQEDEDVEKGDVEEEDLEDEDVKEGDVRSSKRGRFDNKGGSKRRKKTKRKKTRRKKTRRKKTK
jgi:hypothetical protein